MAHGSKPQVSVAQVSVAQYSWLKTQPLKFALLTSRPPQDHGRKKHLSIAGSAAKSQLQRTSNKVCCGSVNWCRKTYCICERKNKSPPVPPSLDHSNPTFSATLDCVPRSFLVIALCSDSHRTSDQSRRGIADTVQCARALPAYSLVPCLDFILFT